MKKLFLIFSVVLILASCATIDTVSKMITPKGYSAPVSYEKAYSYRTDKPYKNINSIISANEKQRTTAPSSYVLNVCNTINQSAKNDFEKVKMAHDVTAGLISYDAAGYWAGTIPEQDWASVLKRKTAVCEGYANLFKKFCDTLKIPCEVIHGYARGVGTSLTDTENPRNTNHAWNLVRIEEACYLVDTTWDSGYMDGKVSKQSYTTDWLFINGEVMIYSHFPENSRHQLLTNPVSAEAFTSLPDLRPKFFDAVSKYQDFQKINNVKNSFSFSYDISSDNYSLSFGIYPVSKEVSLKSDRDYTFTRNLGSGKYEVLFSFPETGLWTVNIYYRKSGEKIGHGCGSFLVSSSQKNTYSYPLVYATTAKNVQLISPLEAPLKKGTSYNFSIHIDDMSSAAVIINKDFIYLKNDGNGNFSGTVQIPNNAKEVKLSASSSASGTYWGLYSFPVE